jgi:hypothetical protein
MRSPVPIAIALIALSLAACGDDETTSSTIAGASGTSGAQGAAVAALSVGEFIDASIPAQLEAATQAAEANPDCAEVDTAAGGDFQVAVAIDAASASAGTPISEIVADNC